MEISQGRPMPVYHNDPHNPVLRDPETKIATITVEQEGLIRQVLLLASSDTRFAQKAAEAIRAIMTTGSTNLPVITSIEPASKPIGSTQFKLKTKGTGFSQLDTIYVNGNAVPTLYVSATELNTDVSLASVSEPASYPVAVMSGSGVVSNSMLFQATAVE